MKAKITKRAVDAAKPAKRDWFIWDTEVRGFGLKVTPAGNRVFSCRSMPVADQGCQMRRAIERQERTRTDLSGCQTGIQLALGFRLHPRRFMYRGFLDQYAHA